MKNISDMTVGERFKYFRLQSGLSQAQVAEGICSYSAISQIECDRALPSARTLGKLAERLGVPLREIMGSAESDKDTRFQLDVVRVHIATGDYTHALRLISDLENNHELLKHQQQDLLLCRAECLTRTGASEEAIKLLVPFIEAQVSKESFKDELICAAYNQLGTAYYHSRDYQKAFASYEQGYRISLRMKELNNDVASVALNLGISCNQLGMHGDAARYLQKAYDFYQSNSDIRSLANSMFSLAIATGNQEYITQALTLYNSINDIRNAYLAQQYYLFHFRSKQDYRDAAEEIARIANQFVLDLKDSELAIYLFGRAFMVCQKNNDMEQAGHYLTQAECLLDQVGNKESHRVAYYHRCNAIHGIAQNNYEKAIYNSTISSQLYAKMGMYTESADSLQLCADAYSSQGLFKEAYETLQEVNMNLRLAGRVSDE